MSTTQGGLNYFYIGTLFLSYYYGPLARFYIFTKEKSIYDLH